MQAQESPSILVLLVGCWEGEGGRGGEQKTLLDNRFLNMSDRLRKSSALLTSHYIVKDVVKKV